MGEEDAFLAALRADPSDPVVRCAYADWLYDHSRELEGHFRRENRVSGTFRTVWRPLEVGALAYAGDDGRAVGRAELTGEWVSDGLPLPDDHRTLTPAILQELDPYIPNRLPAVRVVDPDENEWVLDLAVVSADYRHAPDGRWLVALGGSFVDTRGVPWPDRDRSRVPLGLVVRGDDGSGRVRLLLRHGLDLRQAHAEVTVR